MDEPIVTGRGDELATTGRVDELVTTGRVDELVTTGRVDEPVATGVGTEKEMGGANEAGRKVAGSDSIGTDGSADKDMLNVVGRCGIAC